MTMPTNRVVELDAGEIESGGDQRCDVGADASTDQSQTRSAPGDAERGASGPCRDWQTEGRLYRPVVERSYAAGRTKSSVARHCLRQPRSHGPERRFAHAAEGAAVPGQ